MPVLVLARLAGLDALLGIVDDEVAVQLGGPTFGICPAADGCG